MNSVLSFIIQAKDQASAVLRGVGDRMGELRTKIAGAFSGMGGLGGLISAGAIVGATKSVIDYAGAIDDMSKAAGMTAEPFQALARAAKLNGVEIWQLSGSLNRLRNAAADIGRDQTAQDAFKRLGLSVEEVRRSNPEQVLQKVAKGIRDTGDASAAFDLLGRGAANLLSTLDEVADGWDPLVAKMRKGIISAEDISTLDRAGDELDDFFTRAKVSGAKFLAGWSDLWSQIGYMSTGMNLFEAIDANQMDKMAEQVGKKAAQMRTERRKREAEDKAAREEEAKKVATAGKEGDKIRENLAMVGLSDKEKAVKIEEQLAALSASANEDGLTALERQNRLNEALKKEIELRELSKRIKEQGEANAEKARQELSDATERELNAQVERQDAQAEYELSLKTPEEKMAEVERRILQWRENLAKAESEIEKKEATDGLLEQLRARDTLKKEAADKAEALAEREGSLMERDRELRESRMTPEQRIAESRKRQSDLERQLADEADPEKRMALREKIMDETERQAGLMEKPERKSLSIGDVFERMYGQDKAKDPAREQVDLLRDVKLTLEKIEKKKGGMAP